MTMLFREPVQLFIEQARWMEARGWIYQLLVEFLSRPPRMSSIAYWRKQVEIKRIVPTCEGGRKLKSYLESIPESELRRTCYEEAEEYERLFLGTNAKLAVCESAYRAKTEGISAFTCIAQVRQAYMEQGVVFNKISGERDDHISMELEFMAVLGEEILSKAGLPKSCMEVANAQIQFLESHLLKWVPQFSAELSAATTSRLYAILAELIVEFLTIDLKQLQQLPALRGLMSV